MQLDVFPDRMRLKREEPSKNIRRFYSMMVQPDLFGGASLISEWGRICMAGQVRVDRLCQVVDAQTQLDGNVATQAANSAA